MRAKLLPEEISHQIVSKVADAEGVPPTELTPLAEVIDPDALEKMFSADFKTEKAFRFAYEGYTVVVEGRGEVSLEK